MEREGGEEGRGINGEKRGRERSELAPVTV